MSSQTRWLVLAVCLGLLLPGGAAAQTEEAPTEPAPEAEAKEAPPEAEQDAESEDGAEAEQAEPEDSVSDVGAGSDAAAEPAPDDSEPDAGVEPEGAESPTGEPETASDEEGDSAAESAEDSEMSLKGIDVVPAEEAEQSEATDEATGDDAPLPKVVVPRFEGTRDIDKEIKELLDEVLLTSLVRTGLFDVIGASDIEAMLKMSVEQYMLGCDDETCLADLGGALGGDYLTNASIGRVGDNYVINLKLINVKNVTTVGRHSEQVPGDEDVLVGSVIRGVAVLTDDFQPEGSKLADREAALARDATRRKIAWSTVGVSAAATIGGAVALVVRGSSDRVDKAYDAYQEAQTPEEARDAYRRVEARSARYNRLTVTGAVLLGVGVAGLGVGGLLLKWVADNAPAADIQVSVGAGSVYLSGSF